MEMVVGFGADGGGGSDGQACNKVPRGLPYFYEVWGNFAGSLLGARNFCVVGGPSAAWHGTACVGDDLGSISRSCADVQW
jgi:hypothetical protein